MAQQLSKSEASQGKGFECANSMAQLVSVELDLAQLIELITHVDAAAEDKDFLGIVNKAVRCLHPQIGIESRIFCATDLETNLNQKWPDIFKDPVDSHRWELALKSAVAMSPDGDKGVQELEELIKFIAEYSTTTKSCPPDNVKKSLVLALPDFEKPLSCLVKHSAAQGQIDALVNQMEAVNTPVCELLGKWEKEWNQLHENKASEIKAVVEEAVKKVIQAIKECGEGYLELSKPFQDFNPQEFEGFKGAFQDVKHFMKAFVEFVESVKQKFDQRIQEQLNNLSQFEKNDLTNKDFLKSINDMVDEIKEKEKKYSDIFVDCKKQLNQKIKENQSLPSEFVTVSSAFAIPNPGSAEDRKYFTYSETNCHSYAAFKSFMTSAGPGSAVFKRVWFFLLEQRSVTIDMCGVRFVDDTLTNLIKSFKSKKQFWELFKLPTLQLSSEHFLTFAENIGWKLPHTVMDFLNNHAKGTIMLNQDFGHSRTLSQGVSLKLVLETSTGGAAGEGQAIQKFSDNAHNNKSTMLSLCFLLGACPFVETEKVSQ